MGVPQGSILSPIAFTIYLEQATKELRNYVKENNGEIILYADDMLMIDKTKIVKLMSIVDKMESIWNLKVNWPKSDYLLIGKGSNKEMILGIGNKVKELKYLGITLAKGVKRSTKNSLNKLVKERTRFYQRRIYNRLNKATKLGLQWFEISNICYKTLTDWKLGLIKDNDIDNAFTKIIRCKTSIPKYASKEEVLALVDITPLKLLKRIVMKDKKPNLKKKDWWSLIMNKLPAYTLLEAWKDHLWKIKEEGKILGKSEMETKLLRIRDKIVWNWWNIDLKGKSLKDSMKHITTKYLDRKPTIARKKILKKIRKRIKLIHRTLVTNIMNKEQTSIERSSC